MHLDYLVSISIKTYKGCKDNAVDNNSNTNDHPLPINNSTKASIDNNRQSIADENNQLDSSVDILQDSSVNEQTEGEIYKKNSEHHFSSDTSSHVSHANTSPNVSAAISACKIPISNDNVKTKMKEKHSSVLEMVIAIIIIFNCISTDRNKLQHNNIINNSNMKNIVNY